MSSLDLFVTGMARSGTTLLEKMLAAHPQLSVLSQPCPHLFLDAKRRFFNSLGQAQPRHPLGHLFGNDRYQAGELDRFLASLWLEEADLRAVFEGMEGYSGQWTKVADLDSLIAGLGVRRFADALRSLDRRLAHRTDARGYGSKEIRCEEFLPHLLYEGFHCVVVVRDPRDVIASMSHGEGEQFVGAARPVLFDLRMWRKSVAYALLLRDHPRFHFVRYEDLVSAPEEHAQVLAHGLGIDAYPDGAFRQGIPDQNGGWWTGNSSHGAHETVDAGSVGAHARCLDASLLGYIETVCLPEMQLLGYKAGQGAPDLEGLERFEERGAVRSGDLPADYSSAPEHVEAERARLRAYMDPAWDGCGAVSLFLFARVAQILRAGRG